MTNEITDRLGLPANSDDGWFDAEVATWSEPDGNRLHTIELSRLGQKVVDWITRGELSIPQAIFDEMEEMISAWFGTEKGRRARELSLYVLEGLDAEILQLRNSEQRKLATATIRNMMGDETRLNWVLVESE
jgi:hypothetical protein